MTKKEVQMLIKLREFTRQEFGKVEGKDNPMAQIQSQKAAWVLSSIVKSLDDVLKNHVEIR